MMIDYYHKYVKTSLNITSKYIPKVGNFLEFWKETIVTDPSEEELEIEEITFLFKKWNNKYNLQITENFILDLIRHYYPNVVIIDNKYLLDIKCLIWDKKQDVLNSLEYHKLMHEASKKKQLITNNLELPALSNVPVNLDFYKKGLKAKILGIIEREWIALKLNELFVIEFYSRKI